VIQLISIVLTQNFKFIEIEKLKQPGYLPKLNQQMFLKAYMLHVLKIMLV